MKPLVTRRRSLTRKIGHVSKAIVWGLARVTLTTNHRCQSIPSFRVTGAIGRKCILLPRHPRRRTSRTRSETTAVGNETVTALEVMKTQRRWEAKELLDRELQMWADEIVARRIAAFEKSLEERLSHYHLSTSATAAPGSGASEETIEAYRTRRQSELNKTTKERPEGPVADPTPTKKKVKKTIYIYARSRRSSG